MTERTVIDLPSSRNRSRVSNGRGVLAAADGRSVWSRRFKDLCAIYAAHVGGDPTAPQMALIRRISALDVEAEAMESAMAEGRSKDVDIDCYNRISGNQRRLLQQLGFEETKRTITPSTVVDHFSRPVSRGSA